MGNLTNSIKEFIIKHKMPIVIIAVVLILSTVFITQKALEITETPIFCGKNCHIMRPYYESWSISTHNKTKCVDCHYEPGVIGHIKGKIGGLFQMYNYETTTEEYSGSLYARVLDDNCLNCHKNKRLSDSTNFLGTNFSHKVHLSEPKREVSLNCISCHSMRVSNVKEHRSVISNSECRKCHPSIAKEEDIGHIVVSTQTCFTCHFREISGKESISKCSFCHKSPVNTHYNYTILNHKNHTDRGYSCTTCHTNISLGVDNVVQKTKCYTCHNIEKRVEMYSDINFVHQKHVTTNKIACFECHSGVTHEPELKKNVCDTCHSNQHPNDWLTTHKKEANDKMCSNCHQTKFCSDCHSTVVLRR